MNRTMIKELRKAFQKLGIELAKSGTFYEFEYEHIPMLLSIDATDHSFAFVSLVVDSGDGNLNESILNTALDIVEGFHKDCCGVWNEGTPYFASPSFSFKEVKSVSSDWLKEQLKAFYDAFLFLEANIHLLCDSSIWASIDRIDNSHQ